jgi:Ca2+:H+ antiporter
MLLLAAGAILLPAIFQLISGGGLPVPGTQASDFGSDLEQISAGVAVVLLIVYGAGLLFSLRTHSDLFNPDHDDEHVGDEPWTVRRSVLMLAIAGAAVGLMSELLVGSITGASEGIGLSTFFVGIIVVAVVGNAAEHWVAIAFAYAARSTSR